MNVVSFWDIVQCTAYVNRRFGRKCELHVQGPKPAEQETSVLKWQGTYAADFRKWRRWWYVLPKRLFIYGIHGARTQKMETFLICKHVYSLQYSHNTLPLTHRSFVWLLGFRVTKKHWALWNKAQFVLRLFLRFPTQFSSLSPLFISRQTQMLYVSLNPGSRVQIWLCFATEVLSTPGWESATEITARTVNVRFMNQVSLTERQTDQHK
jgi:hypothetical protein